MPSFGIKSRGNRNPFRHEFLSHPPGAASRSLTNPRPSAATRRWDPIFLVSIEGATHAKVIDSQHSRSLLISFGSSALIFLAAKTGGDEVEFDGFGAARRRLD